MASPPSDGTSPPSFASGAIPPNVSNAVPLLPLRPSLCGSPTNRPPGGATRRRIQRQINTKNATRGQVRLVGVHSEPHSLAERVRDEEEEEREGGERVGGTERAEEEQRGRERGEGQERGGERGDDDNSTEQRHSQQQQRYRHMRQHSAMPSLLRQATVSAAASAAFSSGNTATTIANALELAATVAENPQPNVPPPSRQLSSLTSSFASLSSNSAENGTDSPAKGNSATFCARRTTRKAPTLQCTSSEEGTDSPLFSRTTSAQSLPAPATDQSQSLYERTLHQLTNDPHFQKEIALGKRIGFYRLGKELGAGNFSKVKLGVHVLTKEKVAIKVMEKSKLDQKALRLLTREMENMELMHHPNIIRLFEVVTTLSKTYLVMEYAGGGELYTYVHETGKLTEEVAKPIFAQIVSAVAHLHGKGICHRDIKAENVFLSHPGWVKLGDFGFSCAFDTLSRLNTFCGSPPYAAPELFRDQSYIGPMVDIWALGILLYFMLVGVTPFRGETVSDLKRNILDGSFYIPEYVSTFAQHSISRMLEMDVSRRANISELRRIYWLSDCKFPESYLQLSLNPDEGELKHSELEKQVWTLLDSYGINEQMIRNAQGKGARNAIIGAYRIILFQCQAKDRDEERTKLSNHLLMLASRDHHLAARLNQRSKACTII
ncbi:hypothetical protein niasHS_003447 [Heterodera schachtii]|uniref:non-specific serine/threonine protein kinase n=1 Tax=Heterodera schachtii TaxID=97005 RepID=A0ABD2KH15_HETSC